MSELFATQDEAIAAALAESDAGEQVAIHAATCGSRGAASSEEAESRCTCTPTTLTAGACA